MRRTDASSMRAWDGLMAFWVVLWIVVGAWTGYEIWQLTGLSSSTVESGRSLKAAADAIANLQQVPVVGDASKGVATRIGSTGDRIVAAGQQADRSIRGLAVLIGLAVAFGPSAPVLLFYLPARRRWRLERPRAEAEPPTAAVPSLW